MELPSKRLEQITFNTRPRIEEHILFVIGKSTNGEHSSHRLQTNNNQFEIVVTFLTGYNGFFNITNKINKFLFTVSINDDDFNQLSNPQGAYEIESLNKGIKRNFIKEGFFQESNYPFTIKPILSTLGSIMELSSNITGSQIVFTPDDSMKDLLEFKPKQIHEECKLSDYPVDILSFDNIFIHTDIAQIMIFRDKLSEIIHNFTTHVDPGYK